MDIIKETHMIYNKLADTISREIFANRIAYSLTGHMQSIRNVINTFSSGREFIKGINQAIAAKRKLCIFGAGVWGKNILVSNSDIDFFCFIDNDADKCGKAWGGYQYYVLTSGLI